MAQADFGTGKSLVVLAIVLGCFAILWPKIFYPMMQTAFAMTSPKVDADGRFKDGDRIPPHLHSATGSSKMRSSGANDMHDKFLMREGRPFPHPQARQPAKAQPKSGGAMSIIMPIYTVGIVVFFLYTVLKLVFKKPQEAEKKPLIKDFHMDPEYRKFVCQQPTSTSFKSKNKAHTSGTPDTQTASKVDEELTQELDPKDYEIFKLRKKLEETEQAMERIMRHMGVVNACLDDTVKFEKKLTENDTCDIRQRHKGKSKDENHSDSKEGSIINEVEGKLPNGKVTSLEDDLAELINLCNETGKSIKAYEDLEEEKSTGSKDDATESKSEEEESTDNDQHYDDDDNNNDENLKTS